MHYYRCKIFQVAENLLYVELGIALGKPKQQICKTIIDYMNQSESRRHKFHKIISTHLLTVLTISDIYVIRTKNRILITGANKIEEK